MPLAISALTVREVRKGVVKLRTKKREVADQIEVRMHKVFDAFRERILPVTRDVADLWGELLGQSDKHVDDTGLVATARIYGLTLVTRNLKQCIGPRCDDAGSLQVDSEDLQATCQRAVVGDKTATKPKI